MNLKRIFLLTGITLFAVFTTASLWKGAQALALRSQGANPLIEFRKTVGLEADRCAQDNILTVEGDTPVTYCFQVTNISSVTLDYHTLEDSALGILLAEKYIPLRPGETYFLTQTVWITHTVINTATWTTFAAQGGFSDSITATAEVVFLPIADLVITKTASHSLIEVGKVLTYTIQVKNKGPDTAKNPILTDYLPIDVQFISVSTRSSPPQRSFSIDIALDPLEPGSMTTISLTFSTQRAEDITNLAVIDFEGVDPDETNNSDQVETRVVEASEVRPIVEQVSPESGLNTEETIITIRGENFQDGAMVFLGETQLLEVTFLGENKLEALVPPGLPGGTYDLRVVNPDGGEGVLLHAFSVLEPGALTITEVHPTRERNTEPVRLEIFGTNFSPQITATLTLSSGVGAPTRTASLSRQVVLLEHLIFKKTTELRGTVPFGILPGTYDLTLTDDRGNSATLPGAYTALEGDTFDDLSSESFDIWLDPPTPYADGATTLGVNIRRHSGEAIAADTPVTITVDFFLDTPPLADTPCEQMTHCLGSADVQVGTNEVVSASILWSPLPPQGDYLLFARVDAAHALDEAFEDNNLISRTVTVLHPLGDFTPPEVISFTINQGEINTTFPQVSLSVHATNPNPLTDTTPLASLSCTSCLPRPTNYARLAEDAAPASVLYIEYEYEQSLDDWLPVAESEWLDYQSASSDFPWALDPTPGVHYINVWVADRAGNVSDPKKAFINYLPEEADILHGEGHIYRYWLDVGESLLVRLVTLSGDANLFVWDEDNQGVISSTLDTPVEEVTINPTGGRQLFQVEVYGFIDSTYRLEVVHQTALSARAGDEKRSHLKNRDTPFIFVDDSPTGRVTLPSAPQTSFAIFLPLILR